MRKLIPALAIGALLTVLAPASVMAVTITASPSFASSVGQDQTYLDSGSGSVSTDPGILKVDGNGNFNVLDHYGPYQLAHRVGQLVSKPFTYTGPTGGALNWGVQAVSLRQVVNAGSAWLFGEQVTFTSTVDVWLVASNGAEVDSQQLVTSTQGKKDCATGTLGIWQIGIPLGSCPDEVDYSPTGFTRTLQGSSVVQGQSYQIVFSVSSDIYGISVLVSTGLDCVTTVQGITASASWGPSTDAIFDVNGYFAYDTSGATYHPLDPTRILDTRPASKIGDMVAVKAHQPDHFTVAGRGGVPSDAVAVTGNVTVTNQSAAGWLYLGPNPIAYPISSTLNFGPLGDNRANGVTSKIGIGGYIYVTYGVTSGSVDVIFDVTGYYTYTTQESRFHPLNPTRVLDTRPASQTGTPIGTLAAKRAETFSVNGSVYAPSGVPLWASAVTGNLTVVGATAPGYLYLGTTPNNNPTTSTLNFPAGDTRANGVTVKLATNADLSVTFVATGGAADVLFDVTGYYAPDYTGASYHPLDPARILDTRPGSLRVGTLNALQSHVAQAFAVTGQGGVASSAVAVTGNLTVANQTALGWLYVGPDKINYPSSSTINFPLGDIRANGVTVQLGAGGTLALTYGG